MHWQTHMKKKVEGTCSCMCTRGFYLLVRRGRRLFRCADCERSTYPPRPLRGTWRERVPAERRAS